MNFHERLAEARRARGLTQSEIAEKLDVSFQAVSLWERGETVPDTEKLYQTSRVLPLVSEATESALGVLRGNGEVSQNPVAAMVRLLDCYAGGETKPSEEITALIREVKNRYPMYSNQLFLLTYGIETQA